MQTATNDSDNLELEAYSSIFNQHLKETQRHLQIWTETEMDAFFHGLSVYTRFRPDLIATCVKTKNILEVVEYLDLLENGSKRHKREHPHGRGLPVAHEMSKDWIAWEEKHAELIRARESHQHGQDRVPREGQPHLSESRDVKPSMNLFATHTDNHCEANPRELSPSSRRRLQKRMHMRRRRAKDRGEEANMTHSLLKPGRRSKNSSLFVNKTNLSPRPGRIDSPAPPEAGINFQTSNLLPSVKAEEDPIAIPHATEVVSVKPDDIQSSESNFIHVPNLRNFLRFHTGLYDKRLLDGKEDINTEVVDTLTMMTTDFISEVIGRIVVILEEQRKMKGSIKAWRQENCEENILTVSQSIIQRCLESMGVGMKIRKQCFQALLASFDFGDDSGTILPVGGDSMHAFPIHPDYLPRNVASASGQIDLFSEDGTDTDSQDDHLLDEEDALADKSYETGLWQQIRLYAT